MPPVGQFMYQTKLFFSSSYRVSFTITRTMVSMTIKNVTKVDGGIYTAKISNNVSDAKAEFTLAVRDKPDKPTGKISSLSLLRKYRLPIKVSPTSP